MLSIIIQLVWVYATSPTTPCNASASRTTNIIKSWYSSLSAIVVLDEELGRNLVVTALPIQQRNLVRTV